MKKLRRARGTDAPASISRENPAPRWAAPRSRAPTLHHVLPTESGFEMPRPVAASQPPIACAHGWTVTVRPTLQPGQAVAASAIQLTATLSAFCNRSFDV